MDFYEDIAADYDAMTASPQRSQRLAEFTQALIQRYQPRRVLDVACGSGGHAVALAQAGVEVTAVDASPSMLAQAGRAAQNANVSVHWVHAPMQTTTDVIVGPFDLILCLGNSLPHLLTDDHLHAAFARFAALLRPDGVALIHLLNYPRILEQRDRIVAISRSANTQFIRFYDFLESTVRFNLLRITWPPDEALAQHRLTSTELRPYTPDQISSALRHVQFHDLGYYGNTRFDPFNPTVDQSVFIEAFR